MRLFLLPRQSISRKETGTFRYETRYNAEETECIVLDRNGMPRALPDLLWNIREPMGSMSKTWGGTMEGNGKAGSGLNMAFGRGP